METSGAAWNLPHERPSRSAIAGASWWLSMSLRLARDVQLPTWIATLCLKTCWFEEQPVVTEQIGLWCVEDTGGRNHAGRRMGTLGQPVRRRVTMRARTSVVI